MFIHGGGVALPPAQQNQLGSGSGGSGITTFFSPDGQQWRLIRHVWPLYGGCLLQGTVSKSRHVYIGVSSVLLM